MATSGDRAMTVAGQTRRTVLATSLLRVLADYTAQALDETRSLAKEGEDKPEEAFPAEMRDLEGRLRRIRIVLHTLQRWRRQSERDTHGRQPDGAANGGWAIRGVLHGLHTLYTHVAPHEMPGRGATDTAAAISSHMLRRLGRSASLIDVALELNGRNARTVYRRAGSHGGGRGVAAQLQLQNACPSAGTKRLRDAAGQRTALSLSVVTSEQRAARRELYSGRAALLPRVEAAMTPFFVSPAVRRYAELNAAIEATMLRDAWCVHTKAHLLRDLPRLHEAVRNLRAELQGWLGEHRASVLVADHNATASVSNSSNALDALSCMQYFTFDEVDEGVVRVWVQRALCLDVTYDMVRQVWLVLRLHWNMWASASAVASNVRDLVLSMRDTRQPAAAVAGTASWCRVQPPHQPAMVQYLQRRFTEGGFDEGCLAAQRLLCTVVMDTMAYQLAVLREECFVGPLAPLLSTDVRAGTYVACRFQPFTAHATHAGLEGGAQAVHTVSTRPGDSDAEIQRTISLLVKCTITGGTVVVERTWQGDVAHQRADLVLPLCERRLRASVSRSNTDGPSDGGSSSFFSAVVLDVEQLLWDSVLPS